jgi:hypothetical protein
VQGVGRHRPHLPPALNIAGDRAAPSGFRSTRPRLFGGGGVSHSSVRLPTCWLEPSAVQYLLVVGELFGRGGKYPVLK